MNLTTIIISILVIVFLIIIYDLFQKEHAILRNFPLFGHLRYIAATLDPDIRPAALGIVVGGLIPLILIPFLEKYVTKSKHHIAIGDHEDLKKDLEKEHK